MTVAARVNVRQQVQVMDHTPSKACEVEMCSSPVLLRPAPPRPSLFSRSRSVRHRLSATTAQSAVRFTCGCALKVLRAVTCDGEPGDLRLLRRRFLHGRSVSSFECSSLDPPRTIPRRRTFCAYR